MFSAVNNPFSLKFPHPDFVKIYLSWYLCFASFLLSKYRCSTKVYSWFFFLLLVNFIPIWLHFPNECQIYIRFISSCLLGIACCVSCLTQICTFFSQMCLFLCFLTILVAMAITQAQTLRMMYKSLGPCQLPGPANYCSIHPAKLVPTATTLV